MRTLTPFLIPRANRVLLIPTHPALTMPNNYGHCNPFEGKNEMATYIDDYIRWFPGIKETARRHEHEHAAAKVAQLFAGTSIVKAVIMYVSIYYG